MLLQFALAGADQRGRYEALGVGDVLPQEFDSTIGLTRECRPEQLLVLIVFAPRRLAPPRGPTPVTLGVVEQHVGKVQEERRGAGAIGVGRPDVLMRQGSYKWMPPLPAIPGNEVAGWVESIGPVEDGPSPEVAVGDRVLLGARELPQRGGGYAEFACAPAAALYPLPDDISLDAAVSLPNFQLAQALLFGCGAARPVRSVLITAAAGGVATAMLQTARARGLHIIATASTEAEREFVIRQGASAALDPQAADLAEQVKAHTGSRGVDLALDPSGGGLFIKCLHALAPLGLAVSYNVFSGMPPEVFAVLRQLLGRSLAVRTFSMHTFDADAITRRALMHDAIELMANGAVQSPPVTVLPLEDARRAHEWLDDGGFTGKLVLHP